MKRGAGVKDSAGFCPATAVSSTAVDSNAVFPPADLRLAEDRAG